MSDFHFLVRHGLTGVILIIFMIVGVALYHFDPAHAAQYLGEAGVSGLVSSLSSSFVQALVATALLPVFGIVIQSAYILFVTLRGRLFTDDARCIISNYVKAALDVEFPSGTPRPPYAKQLEDSTPDSPFVWLYYVSAPAHLIDWARRRRSYHYLGVNWGVAAVLGIAFGLVYPAAVGAAVHRQPLNDFLVVGVLLGTVVWVAVAWFLAFLMKRDVDDMELAWSHWRVSETFRTQIGEVGEATA